ncbi:unnamed protein product, partial [Rotaria sordida]
MPNTEQRSMFSSSLAAMKRCCRLDPSGLKYGFWERTLIT